MSNAFADARTALVAALEQVLPGRVFPYEPPKGMHHRPGGGPTIWIDVALPAQRSSGQSTIVKCVQFPVVISFDGSDDAQVAGLDELQAKALDAIAGLAHTRWVGVTVPIPQPGGNRSVIHQIETTIGVGSFCAPAVTAADIPPPIVRTAAA